MNLKSKFVELGTDDDKAKEYMIESLYICAHDHVLSRKILDKFSESSGPMVAIVGEWQKLDELSSYNGFMRAPEGEYAQGDRPTERLVAFIKGYLMAVENALVVCENWGAERAHIANWSWPPPRIACYGDKEVYHILTNDIDDPEMIEAAVKPSHYWQTGLCSRFDEFPVGDIPDEATLDSIVCNVTKIFVPAFDNTGYLIWTPE